MTTSLSVLMFCPQFRPIVGGAERQAEKLAKALVMRGLRVTVLTPRFVSDTPEYEDADGVMIYRFPLFDLHRRLPRLRGLGPLNLLSMRAQILRAVSNNMDGVDVVHCHIASALTAFAMQAAQIRNIPVLCKVAMGGLDTDLAALTRIGYGGSNLAKALVRQLDCWVATTEAVRESLLQWGIAPEKIASIPNGVTVDVNCVPVRETPAARRFLYLGRLATNINRDVPTLIRAFDRACNIVPDLELAIVGSGDLYQDTISLVAKIRNRSRVQVPGLQEPEPWLRWADCLVHPSRYEGLSNALLEAMGHALPCIANDIPANREVLDDGRAGILVAVGDENHLFYEILKVAKESSYAYEIGRLALDRVINYYSIDAVADQYIHLYGKILEGDFSGRS